MIKRQLSIYLIPSSFCNLGCSHCYVPKTARADKTRMSKNRILKMLDLIRKISHKKHYSHLLFIWHGGEPLLLSTSYLIEMLILINTTLQKWGYKNSQYRHSLQTSLIPLTQQHIPLIKQFFNGHIGSSIDFTQRTIKKSQQEYEKQWLEKIAFVRNQGITVFPITVPSKKELHKTDQLTEWFIQHEFNAVSFERYNHYLIDNNQIKNDLKKSLRPTNHEYARFLISLFNDQIFRLDQHLPTIRISQITAGINVALNQQSGDRWGTRCQENYLTIDPHGNIIGCPDLLNIEPPFGTIEMTVNELLNSTQRRHWIRKARTEHYQDFCLSCRYAQTCHSGCPITENGPDQDNCSGYKPFLDHIVHFCNEVPTQKQLCLNYLHQKVSAFRKTNLLIKHPYSNINSIINSNANPIDNSDIPLDTNTEISSNNIRQE